VSLCKLTALAFLSFAGGILVIGTFGGTFGPFVGALLVAGLPWAGAMVVVYGVKNG
jgi:hypothetical protein